MDAVRFLKEKDRMCEYYEYCEGCPLADGIEIPSIYCTCPEEEPEEIVTTIEKWSNAHPIRTNADYVAEKLREIGYTVDIEELRVKCPPHESSWYANCKNIKPCGSKLCKTCTTWWDEEYTGDERK